MEESKHDAATSQTNEEKAEFYGILMQAKYGNNTSPKPNDEGR